MDPYDEQRLRDEVIYLHSLWHLGPPPRSTFTNSSNGVLHQQSKRTQFKRKKPKPSAQKGYRNNRNQEAECSTLSIQDPGEEWPCNPMSNNVAPTSAWPTRNVQSNSQPSWHSAETGKEWPCNPGPDVSVDSSAWPAFTAQQNSQPISLSPQQQARLAANRAQAKALKATKVFFRSNNSDGDGGEDEDDHLGDSDHDDSEIEEKENPRDSTEEGYGVAKCKFFVKVFADDGKLRDYYQNNYQNGDFSCLVCCGVGTKKSTKRFKDCVALIQHSISIGKTKKRGAHRAYGKAICKVLGWDIHKLPTIVSELSANRGVASGTSDGEAQRHVDGSEDDLNVLGGHSETQADGGNGDKLEEKESTVNETKLNNDESIVFQDGSLIVVDTSKGDEDPDLTAPNIVNGEGSGQQSDVGPVVGGEGKDVSHDLVRNGSAN